MYMKKIFIIILHYGDNNLTISCIESIFKYEKSFYKVIVVDNGGKEVFNYKNNKVEIVRNKINKGYAAGMNTGIKYAFSHSAAYVMLLNNDTIFTEEIIKKLLHVRNNDIGIIGPAIQFIKENSTIYDLGGKVNKITGKTSHFEVKDKSVSALLNAEYISGCCMLIKAEVFEKIGFFDEQFFLYYEDVDFCLRAAKVGLKTVVVPTAFIFHELSSSVGKNSGFAIFHQTKSALLFGKKYLGIKIFFNIVFVSFQSIKFLLKNSHTGRYAILALVPVLKTSIIKKL